MKMKTLSLFMLAVFVSVVHLKAQMRVHLINVGQGCATLIEFPCAAILVDTGGETDSLFHSSDSLKAYLDDFFAIRTDLHNTLQCVYLTHPHKDHTNGINVILDSSYTIKNAVTDGLERGSGRWGQIKLHRAVQAAEENDSTADDIGFEAVTTDEIGNSGFTNSVIDPVSCAGTNPVIKILWGTSATNPGWSDGHYDDENNHSLVIKIQYGSASFLITGDLEDVAQRNLVTKYAGTGLLDSDIYLVGHHGSKNGTSLEFLNMISPKIALIGVGNPDRQFSFTAWDYGHPNKGILDRLQNKLTETRTSLTVKAGTSKRTFVDYLVSKAIYATGWDNHVVLEADAAGLWQKLSKLVPALVNLNTATLSELLTLPGIAETKARAIIEYRSTHGRFNSVDELDNVPGIGPATVNLVRAYVTM